MSEKLNKNQISKNSKPVTKKKDNYNITTNNILNKEKEAKLKDFSYYNSQKSDKLNRKVNLTVLSEFKNEELEEPKENILINKNPKNNFKSNKKNDYTENIQNINVETYNNRKIISKKINSYDRSNQKIVKNNLSKRYIDELASKQINENLNPKTHTSYTKINQDYIRDNEELGLTKEEKMFSDYETYFNSKLANLREDKILDSVNEKNKVKSEENNFDGLELKNLFLNGINEDSNILLNKNERWICYLNYDNLVIECVDDISFKNQIILNINYDIKKNKKTSGFDKETYSENLNCSKILFTEDHNTLIVYSETNPRIISYDVSKLKSISSIKEILKCLIKATFMSKEFVENYNKILQISNLEALPNSSLKLQNKELDFLVLKSNIKELNEVDLFLNQKVKLINDVKLKHKLLKSIIMPSNNNHFCLSISCNKLQESYLSIIDFRNNDILTTTLITEEVKIAKFNPYLVNYEFATISNEVYTFWRLTEDNILQYQNGIFNSQIIKKDNKFKSIEYTPPLSFTNTVLLLVGISDGNILCVDTKTNSVVLIINLFKNLDLSHLNSKYNTTINSIYCGLKYFVIQSNENVFYYKLKPLKDVRHDNLYFIDDKIESCDNFFSFDSEISSLDLNSFSGEGILNTMLGNIYYINIKENISFKLVSKHNICRSKMIKSESDQKSFKKDFVKNENINNNHFALHILSKNVLKYSLRKIDFKNEKFEDYCKVNLNFNQNDNNQIQNNNIDENSNEIYYILTAQNKSGNTLIKVWGYPNNKLIFSFEIINDTFIDLDVSKTDLTVCISFESGCLRFFNLDENNEKIKSLNKFQIGNFKSVSFQKIVSIKYLQDSSFIFVIDDKSTLFLLKIESIYPLLIQIHNIMNIQGNECEIKLSHKDCFNKFGIMINKSIFKTFNRKYTNILKNLSYDSSVPQFYLYDQIEIFNEINLIKNNESNLINLDDKKINSELYESNNVEFCPLNSNNIIVLSKAFNLILIRCTESKTNLRAIEFNNGIISLNINSNSLLFEIINKDGYIEVYNYNICNVTSDSQSNFDKINQIPLTKIESNFSSYFKFLSINNLNDDKYLNLKSSNNGTLKVCTTDCSYEVYNIHFT